MNKYSLRRRLIVWLMPPLLVLWLIGAIISYYYVVNFANGVYDKWLLDSAEDLAQQVHIQSGSVSADLPAGIMHIIESDTVDHIYFRIISGNGNVVAQQGRVPDPPNFDSQPVFYDGQVDEIPVRITALRVERGGGSARVQVAETLVKRRILRNEILAAMLLPQLLLIGSAGLLIWYGVGRGLAPLDDLRLDILRRSHRDLSPLDQSKSPMEVTPLIAALNELFDRLDRALASQNRFIDDAAHQLRTPLAGLKTQAELAVREADPIAMRAALQRVRAAVDRSVHLVNQLLALARADHSRGHPLPTTTLELSKLAREVTAERVAEALVLQLDLGFETLEDVINVRGNAGLLHELLDNLIDNALRYTPAGGTVTVRVTKRAQAAVLEVEDSGPGIALAQREIVFERFYRTEGTPGDGCGLGLAIVREIASLHDAIVSLGEGTNDRGTRVIILFPAAMPNARSLGRARPSRKSSAESLW